jgi:hypothetical protein
MRKVNYFAEWPLLIWAKPQASTAKLIWYIILLDDKTSSTNLASSPKNVNPLRCLEHCLFRPENGVSQSLLLYHGPFIFLSDMVWPISKNTQEVNQLFQVSSQPRWQWSSRALCRSSCAETWRTLLARLTSWMVTWKKDRIWIWSMGRMTSHIVWKIKYVWNHQPDRIW